MGFYSQKYFHHILTKSVINPFRNYDTHSIIKLRNFVFKLRTYSKVSPRDHDRNEWITSRGVESRIKSI